MCVIWNDQQCTSVELTLPFEDIFTDAESRQTVMKFSYVSLCTSKGCRAQLITVHVGSRGVMDLPSLSRFKQMCKATVKEWTSFAVSLAKAAIHHRLIQSMLHSGILYNL